MDDEVMRQREEHALASQALGRDRADLTRARRIIAQKATMDAELFSLGKECARLAKRNRILESENQAHKTEIVQLKQRLELLPKPSEFGNTISNLTDAGQTRVWSEILIRSLEAVKDNEAKVVMFDSISCQLAAGKIPQNLPNNLKPPSFGGNESPEGLQRLLDMQIRHISETLSHWRPYCIRMIEKSTNDGAAILAVIQKEKGQTYAKRFLKQSSDFVARRSLHDGKNKCPAYFEVTYDTDAGIGNVQEELEEL